MSINWVMLDGHEDYVRLPGEHGVFKSTPRVALTLSTPRAYPGNNPFSIQSNSGILFLTNQRVVYIPKESSDRFTSFSASLLNLHDTHVTVPWFGPNGWEAVVEPVPGGNIPRGQHVELKLTFKDGGAPEFHSKFERIKERLQQAVEAARESNAGHRTRDNLTSVNLDSVHLDQLPSYEASGQDRRANEGHGERLVESTTNRQNPSATADSQQSHDRQDSRETASPPSDAPPGYEETQQRSVQEALDRRLNA